MAKLYIQYNLYIKKVFQATIKDFTIVVDFFHKFLFIFSLNNNNNINFSASNQVFELENNFCLYLKIIILIFL